MTSPLEDPANRAEWEAWLAERPPAVRAVAERYPPWKRYLLNGTQVVVIYCYDEPLDPTEPVTLKVDVTHDLNPFLFFGERRVFGVRPEDLEAVEEIP